MDFYNLKQFQVVWDGWNIVPITSKYWWNLDSVYVNKSLILGINTVEYMLFSSNCFAKFHMQFVTNYQGNMEK